MPRMRGKYNARCSVRPRSIRRDHLQTVITTKATVPALPLLQLSLV